MCNLLKDIAKQKRTPVDIDGSIQENEIVKEMEFRLKDKSSIIQEIAHKALSKVRGECGSDILRIERINKKQVHTEDQRPPCESVFFGDPREKELAKFLECFIRDTVERGKKLITTSNINANVRVLELVELNRSNIGRLLDNTNSAKLDTAERLSRRPKFFCSRETSERLTLEGEGTSLEIEFVMSVENYGEGSRYHLISKLHMGILCVEKKDLRRSSCTLLSRDFSLCWD